MNPIVKYPLIEAILLSIVCFWLSYLSASLALPEQIFGLNNRYLADIGGPYDAATRQVLWLVTHLPYVWGLLALALFVSVNVGRYTLPPILIVGVNFLLWGLVWIALHPTAMRALWPWLSGGSLLLSICWAAAHHVRHRQLRQAISHPCLTPGLLLFTGIGWLTLLDYSARGPFKFRFLANEQMDAICIGLATCCLIAGIKPSSSAAITRLLARVDGLPAERSGKLSRHLPLVAMLALNFLWSAGLVHLFGRSSPALTSELLRLPAYLLGAWLICRWGDAPSHWMRAGSLAASAIGTIVIGLLGTDDKGQLLLIGLSGVCLFGSCMALMCGNGRLSILLATLISLAGLFAVHRMLLDFGGYFSARFADRLFAMRNAFTGNLQFLSELRWFSHGAPSLNGYGLGHVPWCGTLASLGVSGGCGIAKQTQSDYFLIALNGVYGTVAGGALVGTMAFWLIAMLPAQPKAAHHFLCYWIIVLFVMITLIQLFYTCLGAMGVVVLTGITFPIMAFGKTSYIVTAGLIGLSLNKEA